jgi:glycosyltransferase involved in cell wall biosynthesis
VLTPRAVRSIGDVLRRERFDVAHCHVSIVSPAAIGGARQAQALGIPTTVTFHSVVPQTRLLAAGLDLAIHASRWPVVFSAVSARVARDIQPLAGSKPVYLLPNGVDASFWQSSPSVAAPRERTFEIVSVMRLNAKKRPFALIEMMRRLVKRCPPPADARPRLRIAGDGPLRASLRRAIQRFGLERDVELLGVRSRDELRAIFAASDVFVMPAIRESFGLAALEARCAGLPVVAMAASGVAELIEHGRDGLLAHSDAELLLHLETLSRDSLLRGRIAAHNRDAPPRCDWDSTLGAHLDIYSEAITLRASTMSRT